MYSRDICFDSRPIPVLFGVRKTVEPANVSWAQQGLEPGQVRDKHGSCRRSRQLKFCVDSQRLKAEQLKWKLVIRTCPPSDSLVGLGAGIWRTKSFSLSFAELTCIWTGNYPCLPTCRTHPDRSTLADYHLCQVSGQNAVTAPSPRPQLQLRMDTLGGQTRCLRSPTTKLVRMRWWSLVSFNTFHKSFF